MCISINQLLECFSPPNCLNFRRAPSAHNITKLIEHVLSTPNSLNMSTDSRILQGLWPTPFCANVQRQLIIGNIHSMHCLHRAPRSKQKESREAERAVTPPPPDHGNFWRNPPGDKHF
uniref:Uncharacterized protein n=1 Tax=Globodera rostochiensis TaxID=31243 RepID=A0A914ICG6_GLORO